MTPTTAATLNQIAFNEKTHSFSLRPALIRLPWRTITALNASPETLAKRLRSPERVSHLVAMATAAASPSGGGCEVGEPLGITASAMLAALKEIKETNK